MAWSACPSTNTAHLTWTLKALCWQGLGRDGLAASEAHAARGFAAPAPSPSFRADGGSPGVLPQQGSGVGLEGEAGNPLQELVSSMRTGQLGHKMNDSDIHNQLVSPYLAVLLLGIHASSSYTLTHQDAFCIAYVRTSPLQVDCMTCIVWKLFSSR